MIERWLSCDMDNILKNNGAIYWYFCTQMDWQDIELQNFIPNTKLHVSSLNNILTLKLHGNVAWPGSYQPLPLGSLPLPSPPLPGFLQSFVLRGLLELPGFLKVGCSVSHDFTSGWFKTIALLWSDASQKLAESATCGISAGCQKGENSRLKNPKTKQNQILPQLPFS